MKVGAGLVVLLLIGFLLIQTLLSTSWVRGKVAAKLSQRVGGLNVQIADLDWTPWGGARIRGLKVGQPELLEKLVPIPLLEVDEVHVWPDYAAALKGELAASQVTVKRPKLHVSAEMLMSIAAASTPAAEPPSIAAAAVPQPAAAVGGGSESESESASTVEAPEAGNQPQAASPKPPVQAVEAPAPPKVVRKRIRVVVEDGGFELVRAGEEEKLAVINGVNLDLPVFGEPAEASSSIALIECLGQVIDDDLKLEVKTGGAGLDFLIVDRPGKKSGIVGRVGLIAVAGVPFRANLGVRRDALDRMKLSEELSVESGEIQMRVNGGGWLQAPGSWSGVGQFGANQVLGQLAGQSLAFGSATGSLQLSGGVIQSPDFRLVGDSASILGNGWVTSRDGAAVLRVVVPYSVVGMMNAGLGKKVPESVFAFKPLQPDNRWYSDVSMWREESGWVVEFGESGSELPIGKLLGQE
ncbi:hypothetical protein [Haloferula sp.]|uniref:hypothetical protein n=1 Tax=Haloferula sp. TaxID=2497595 RepID=UPI00329B7DFD